MKITKNLVPIAIGVCMAIGMSSCGSERQLYSWHKYEDASYQHHKKQTQKTEKKFVKEINNVIKKQRNKKKAAPPGINAEYGYYLYKIGQKDEGVQYLNREISLYPESQMFISRIIAQIKKEDE